GGGEVDEVRGVCRQRESGASRARRVRRAEAGDGLLVEHAGRPLARRAAPELQRLRSVARATLEHQVEAAGDGLVRSQDHHRRSNAPARPGATALPSTRSRGAGMLAPMPSTPRERAVAHSPLFSEHAEALDRYLQLLDEDQALRAAEYERPDPARRRL